MLPPSPLSGIIASGVGRARIGPISGGMLRRSAAPRKARWARPISS